ncbi:DUF2786 domain-containing protein [Flavobacterium sp. SOK18b]|uniref:DUF2786 domain-containing protein n=1 Tax=Flavobacterium sp. SOK18b TaxID=797900 RepID=UPI0015F80B8B|nr:DUF2786 domain-containing protein [Flavobacterium sp. SOK18b]MBB1194839.1 DUF2786 domain-containing protein [Flavobacterium sp. SOK18b]
MNDKIKDKIKALLSKTTDNGATKEEMESALRKANQLMTNFFISEHDLQDSAIINKCVSEQFELTKSGFDLSLFYADLANLFDCEHYYNSKRITFFGHEQDVSLCGYFYNLISKTCLKEKDVYLRTEKYIQLKKHYHGRTLSSSFIKGFLIEVVCNIKELYKEKEKNIPEAYGLIVVEKKQNIKSEFKNLDLKIHHQKQNPLKGERQAFEDGLEKGKEISLVQGIENCKEANLLSIGF